MPSLNDPFLPIPEELLFNPLKDREMYLEKFIEKINSFANINLAKIKNHQGSSITSALYSAIDSVKNLSSRGVSKIIDIYN